jgi:arabinogalactan oligomer/maltooligosaccharide transport system permease protein
MQQRVVSRLGSYSRYLYDEINREYKRKNEYLKNLSEIDELLQDGKSDKSVLQKQRRDLTAAKNRHPHNVKLRDFRKEETEFFKKLKSERSVFSKNLDTKLSRTERSLSLELFDSERKKEFYSSYSELDYDAEYEYKKASLLVRELPDILDYIDNSNDDLDRVLSLRSEIDPVEENLKKKEFEDYKSNAKEAAKTEISRIKAMYKDGVISRKAEANSIRQAKRSNKKSVKLKELEIPSKGSKDISRSKNMEIRNTIKQRLKILKGDIADIRKITPVETEKTRPVIAYLTALIPGVGQVFNKQFGKAVLFLIASAFIYLIAIPYALGYGNYQGEGVAGLASLAEGGARIDKSLIFMIEGVVAIFLLLLAALLYYVSFMDVYRVESGKIKGVRPKSWFEIKKAILEDGFPYMSSLPALVIILFIVLVPVITTILLSFTNMDPQHQSKFSWIGLENYKLIALGQGLAGSVFWLILVWTLIWTVAATTLAILLGFFLALMVNNDRVMGKRFFRTIYILPWAVPAFITIMFFSIMTAPGGVISELLSDIFKTRIEIKNNMIMTRFALILIQGWLGSAYVFLLTTGVLQSIPGDLYEAAEIDGATVWDKVRRITVPLVLFQISPLLVTQYTFNFNNFSVIFLFNEGGPFNPQKYGNLAGSSDLLISYIYKLAMVNQYQAIGAAITVFISIGLMIFAYIGFRNSKGFKEGRL